MITFIFCEPGGLIGKIIRKLTQGKFSHVAIYVNGYVYEALEFKGIIRTEYNEWQKKRNFEITTENILNKDSEKFKIFLESKLGGKYDYRGIFSFLTFSQSQDNQKYYCSELANEFFEIYYDESDKYLISPNAFFRKIQTFKMGFKSTLKDF